MSGCADVSICLEMRGPLCSPPGELHWGRSGNLEDRLDPAAPPREKHALFALALWPLDTHPGQGSESHPDEPEELPVCPAQP